MPEKVTEQGHTPVRVVTMKLASVIPHHGTLYRGAEFDPAERSWIPCTSSPEQSSSSPSPRCGENHPQYSLMDLDLMISLQFIDYGREISFDISSSSSVQHLLSVILASVKPHDFSVDQSAEIREHAMFIFRSEDLRTKDTSCTLRDLGMKDRADIFIIHPGPLVKGSLGSKIIIEIPAEFTPDSAGTISTFLLHLPVKGKDTIDMVKSKICDRVRSHKDGSPLNYILEVQYVLLFKRKVMVDSWILDECDIKNQDTLVLCRENDFLITILLVLADESSGVQVHGVRVCSFDTVAMLKTKIKQFARIPPEKEIVLRFDENWLEDDGKCLFEYGITELNRGRRIAIVEAVEYDA